MLFNQITKTKKLKTIIQLQHRWVSNLMNMLRATGKIKIP